MLASSAMGSMADLVAEDLTPLGALAERAIAYVTRGTGEDVLDALAGHGKELHLKGSGAWSAARNWMAGFTDGDEAMVERLGHVYAATAQHGHIEELGGDFGREAHALEPNRKTAKACDDFKGHMLEAFSLRNRATSLGYVRGRSEDGGSPLPEENRTVALGALSFEHTRARALALGDVPAVLFSESWNDMRDIAHEGSGFDAAWESKVR